MSKTTRMEFRIFAAVMLAVLPTVASIGSLHFHPPYCGFLFTDSNWQRIQVGMSRSEVWLILGQPDTVNHRYDSGDENWTYEEFLSSYESYEIFFDAKTGTVSNCYYDDF